MQTDHRAQAEALRRRVLEGPGETKPVLRQAAAAAATGGPPMPSPYDELARQIGQAASCTTDRQVSDVVTAAESEKAAFEIVVAAAVGAGIFRWQRAIEALDEVPDAPR